MLVAQNLKGTIFSMTRDRTVESLVNLKGSESFQCPSCKEPVLLKIGNQRVPHFAHVKKRNCLSFSEVESTYHLKGKLQLYEWLNSQGYSPKLEPYFQEIKQRPDVMLFHDKRPYALEYQCSTLDTNRFKERTENYSIHGYQPVWILGGKRLKRVFYNQFSLSSFDWMFTRLIKKKPCLLYYCSESQKFLFLSILSPITTSKVYAGLEVISKHDLSFTSLLSRDQQISFPYTDWLETKKNWRLTCTQFPSHSMKRLIEYLYHNQIPPSLLPAEVGIPVPSMYWIQTPPIIWQAWILIEFIHRLPTLSTFSFQAVYYYFNFKKRNQLLYIRELPLISTSHYSFAILEYLDGLVDMGVLKKLGKKTFQKLRNGHFPLTIDQAISEDRRLILTNKSMWDRRF